MPCIECGESAKRHGGACVGLFMDENDVAHYKCLDCVIEELEDAIERDNQ